MTRAELFRVNEALLSRRKREGVGQPKAIESPIQAVVNQEGATLADYFNALQAGETVHLEDPHRMDTSRVKWESFDSDRHPSLKRAVKTIKQWYNTRLDVGGGLILAGNYGCGKSHLAQAIYDLYGFGAVYINEVKLVEQLQAGYGKDGGGRSLESIAAQCRRARLLIYDDLGAYETDNLKWIQNIYLALLDGRHEEGKATLITTNLKLFERSPSGKVDDQGKPEIIIWSPLQDRLGGRVYSRVMGQVEEISYYVSLFDVKDYRLRNLG